MLDFLFLALKTSTETSSSTRQLSEHLQWNRFMIWVFELRLSRELFIVSDVRLR